METYDGAEHEHRERVTSQVEPSTDDNRKVYHGSVEYGSGDSTDALLKQFKQMKFDS